MLMIFVKKFDENECGDMMWWDSIMLLWKVMMKNVMIIFLWYKSQKVRFIYFLGAGSRDRIACFCASSKHCVLHCHDASGLRRGWSRWCQGVAAAALEIAYKVYIVSTVHVKRTAMERLLLAGVARTSWIALHLYKKNAWPLQDLSCSSLQETSCHLT